MKTNQPLIVTARIAENDLEFFDRLRKAHFPPDRNFLRAHLTMFHRLPGEYGEQIIRHLQTTAAKHGRITAETAGIRHLGAGVAFPIESAELRQVHTELKSMFMPWLGGQDMQTWQPHVTVQNKVSRLTADTLHAQLSRDFQRQPLTIEGIDLWRYLGGPWELERTISFDPASTQNTTPQTG